VFVPRSLPSYTNLVPYLPRFDGRLLTIDYAGKVLVINGPAGCCLDADPRKSEDTLTLPNHITAHFLQVEPQYGGPILWWQQEGTYIALSGPRLTKDVLTAIATSMSKTADFDTAVALPPPGPEGILPSGRIAFAMLRDPVADGGCGRLGVYVLNGGARQPTYLADGCNPVLSPDTRLVAYTRGGHIFVKSADGGPEINVTGDLFSINPAWSPDGKRLAFASAGDGKSDIYIVNADGSQLTRITNSSTDLAAGRLGSDPIWSPDGRRIAFTVSPEVPLTNANWDVYVVEIANGRLTRLIDNPARDGLIDWSPDGSKILFWSERDGGKMNIYVMNADGSDQKQLTNGKYDDSASWSPDGKRIAFTSGDNGQLYMMNADGSELSRLTENLGNTFNPIWLPDGQYLIFGSFSDIWQAAALYVVNADGSHPARLVTTDMFLQWAQR
jgi:Tol biopolymer transport system component